MEAVTEELATERSQIIQLKRANQPETFGDEMEQFLRLALVTLELPQSAQLERIQERS
jgi:hypothetical protein